MTYIFICLDRHHDTSRSSWHENGISRRLEGRKRLQIVNSEKSCTRLKPDSQNCENRVWSYDFFFDTDDDARRLKWMPIREEYIRKCLIPKVDRSITSINFTNVLVLDPGNTEQLPSIRGENEPEFVPKADRNPFSDLDVETRFIASAGPFKNGYTGSTPDTPRDKLLSREVFGDLIEAKISATQDYPKYTTERTHSGVDYPTQAEFATMRGRLSSLPGIGQIFTLVQESKTLHQHHDLRLNLA